MYWYLASMIFLLINLNDSHQRYFGDLTAAPITCNVTQNFVTQEDGEGCRNPVPFDLGKCGGGCGRLPDKCCYKSRMVSSVITLDCPDGRKKEKEVDLPPVELANVTLYVTEADHSVISHLSFP